MSGELTVESDVRPASHDSISAVPYAPIPTDHTELRFNPEDDWTYTASPMRVLWETNYRDAAHSILFGDDRAYAQAAQGRAIESAFLQRLGAETRARREQSPTPPAGEDR